MTCCCVPNCSNRTEKGYSMRSFPINSEQRTAWIDNINIHSDKKLSKHIKHNLFVCEVHFAADMWEKVRVDGKKKLKAHAVPIIFSSPNNANIPAAEENTHIRENNAAQSTNNPVEAPTSSSKRPAIDMDINTGNDAKRLRRSVTDESITLASDESITLASDDTVKILQRKLNEANKKLEKANTIIRNSETTNRILRQRLQQIRNSTKMHSEQNNSLEFLNKVFHKDQIAYLKAKYKGRHIRQWTEETVKKSIPTQTCMWG
ncbi:uncharacterized protein LOC112588584 [Harpegnathos saltator]|uniref:uncharacterized protein LOC112588584 n=1 Tax=Harpegnathos saltator TaxID=610380 RepID=UPI000DBED954|nr:uncharacterized protein LOC112588584 [Harpegnathos saltator]